MIQLAFSLVSTPRLIAHSTTPQHYRICVSATQLLAILNLDDDYFYFFSDFYSSLALPLPILHFYVSGTQQLSIRVLYRDTSGSCSILNLLSRTLHIQIATPPNTFYVSSAQLLANGNLVDDLHGVSAFQHLTCPPTPSSLIKNTLHFLSFRQSSSSDRS